jgi:serine protease Do
LTNFVKAKTKHGYGDVDLQYVSKRLNSVSHHKGPFMHSTLIRSFLSVALVALVLPCEAAWPFGKDRATDRAIEKVYPALVRIYVVVDSPYSGRIRRQRGAGSGAIISPDGYVVTNHHVAGNASRIVVNLSNQEEIEADLVGTDPLSDIAVLKLHLDQRKDPNAPVPVATWGDSDAVKVGDTVLAMGSPAAVSQSITQGIVANTQLIVPKNMGGAFRLDGENVGSLVRWIAHDAVIFGGNSGGPLVNLNGDIIGINEIGLGSLGGAIPGNLARSVANEIIEKGHVDRSWTGITAQPRQRGGPDVKGVLVAGVVDPSPAKEAGLLAGDIITHFDGAAVDCEIPEQLPLFNQQVLGTPIGRTVTVTIRRDDKTVDLQLTTIAREQMQSRGKEVKSWGMTARDLTRLMALVRKRDSQNGVLVQSLRPGGAAGEAKPAIQPSDVIVEVGGKPVNSLEQLRSRTAALTKGKAEDELTPILVAYERGTARLLTVVKVGREEPEAKPALARKPWPACETQVLTTDLAEALGIAGTKGVRVTNIFAGRAAERAGLKVGDLIIKLDGETIDASHRKDAALFATLLRQRRVGQNVDLTVLRDGKEIKVPMKLEAPPKTSERMKSWEDLELEFSARNLAFLDRHDNRLEESVTGVYINKVESGGVAALAGLRVKDILLKVQGKPVSKVSELEAIMTELRKEQPRRISFFVRNGIFTRFLEIEPDWDE